MSYKYALRNSDGVLTMEHGENRTVSLPEGARESHDRLVTHPAENATQHASHALPQVLPSGEGFTRAPGNPVPAFQHGFMMTAPSPAMSNVAERCAFVQRAACRPCMPSQQCMLADFIMFRSRAAGEAEAALAPPAMVVQSDGPFRHEHHWRGTGLAVPVFALRTRNSVGVGEFADIKQLADFGSAAGEVQAPLRQEGCGSAWHAGRTLLLHCYIECRADGVPR